jgi:phosphohistidine phosphatase
MSRILVLLRHAEAQPAGPAAADFDRTLTARGRAQAQEAARRIASAGLYPDLLLASPAARALETAAIVVPGLADTGKMLAPAVLYLASAPVLLSTLQACDDAAQTLLLVGHNPGLSILARELTAGSLPGHDDTALELELCALCRLTLETASWSALGAATVRSAALLA